MFITTALALQRHRGLNASGMVKDISVTLGVIMTY